MHSLGHALSQFDCPITFVGPTADALFPGSPDMAMPEEYKADFRQFSLNFREAEHVEQAIADADVILVEPVIQPDYTQARQEASTDKSLTPAAYKITRELLETKAKSDAILLHSLPRMDEIPADVDITRWSRYWQEAFLGVVMFLPLFTQLVQGISATDSGLTLLPVMLGLLIAAAGSGSVSQGPRLATSSTRAEGSWLPGRARSSASTRLPGSRTGRKLRPRPPAT
jgi:hypothetical protein